MSEQSCENELIELLATLARVRQSLLSKAIAVRDQLDMKGTRWELDPKAWEASPPETVSSGVALDGYVEATGNENEVWLWNISATKRGSSPWEVLRSLELTRGEDWHSVREFPVSTFATTGDLIEALPILADELLSLAATTS